MTGALVLLVILLAAAAVVHIVWGRGQLDSILEDMGISLDKELILSIPMFILRGGVMTKGSTARRLINIAASLTEHLPGGLAVACVLSCGVFASRVRRSSPCWPSARSCCRPCSRVATATSSTSASSWPAARWASSSRRRSR